MMALTAEIPGLHIMICLIGGYLLGSLPFGLIVTKLSGQGDIREIGSGNIGATNVLRTGNKLLAFITLILDGGKGAIAVLLTHMIFEEPLLMYFAGGAAFFGHLYPVFLKFKGGKGVATFLGTLLALNWPLGLGCCLTWFLTMLIFRISSLSALVTAVLSPLYGLFLIRDTELALFSGLLAVMIFIRHKDNIRRLLGGTEPKVGKK